MLTGYLKAIIQYHTFGGDYICEVSLPNKEISYVYSKEIISQFENVIPISVAISKQEAIYTMDIQALQLRLENFLLQTISFHDATNETFYHGLILGLCAMMNNRYRITSNREAGNGRFDILMLPLNNSTNKLPGILIELKTGKEFNDEKLEQLAKNALNQINKRMYHTEMNGYDVKEVLKYGIAFSGKKVCIKAEISNF